MFYRDSSAVYRVSELDALPWLVHGFGTRQAEDFASEINNPIQLLTHARELELQSEKNQSRSKSCEHCRYSCARRRQPTDLSDDSSVGAGEGPEVRAPLSEGHSPCL